MLVLTNKIGTTNLSYWMLISHTSTKTNFVYVQSHNHLLIKLRCLSYLAAIHSVIQNLALNIDKNNIVQIKWVKCPNECTVVIKLWSLWINRDKWMLTENKWKSRSLKRHSCWKNDDGDWFTILWNQKHPCRNEICQISLVCEEKGKVWKWCTR